MENKKFTVRDLIIILMAIAIIILFVMNIRNSPSQKNSTSHETSQSTSSNTTKDYSSITASLPDSKIAFINIDTLNEKYLYISDYVKTMKKRKEALEAQLQSMMTKFQQDYESFQQSVQTGIAPASELEKQKKQLEQQQKDIQNKQLQMDNLAIELQEKNEQLQTDIKEFLIRFNNGKYDYILSYSNALPNVLLANPKYDITKEVVDALNKEYLEKKQSKK